MHGVLAHKDQVYHKKLANRLAEERGFDSFRYDLRGQGGESQGHWGMMNLDDDVVDLQVVLDYLTTEYGYRIHLIVAHSRGSLLAPSRAGPTAASSTDSSANPRVQAQ